ncbi:MAG: YkgJ family cysteine cluster protein [Ottowia sp.]|nr:YkgJ family cysteine cluster protein [Ottowia sp.]
MSASAANAAAGALDGPDRPDRPDCQRCGACCASLRVDFAARELSSQGGCVPDGLAVSVTGHTCRLRGTDHQPPRCAALTGRVGERVACGIYEWRPSPCREFEPGSDACLRARARHRVAVQGNG